MNFFITMLLFLLNWCDAVNNLLYSRKLIK